MGIKVTRIATSGQELAGGSTLDATYSGTDVDVTTGLPLDGLLDVDAPAPADGDVLTWDDASGTWISAVGGGSGLDVTLSTVAASGATETLDVSVARTHDVTLTADCTFTFTGATTGEAWYFTLVLRQDGTGGWETTWPGSIEWASGSAPTLVTTASTAEVLTFFTLDGGTVWFGFESGAGGGIDVALVTVAATGATETVDVSAARTYDLTLDADVTLTLTGASAAQAWWLVLILRQDGTGGWTVTWPGSVVWPDATAPTIDPDPAAVTVVTLGTVDGGTTWLGFPTGGAGTTTTSVGQLLISDTPSTPLVFADLIQNEAQDDLVYAD